MNVIKKILLKSYEKYGYWLFVKSTKTKGKSEVTFALSFLHFRRYLIDRILDFFGFRSTKQDHDVRRGVSDHADDPNDGHQ